MALTGFVLLLGPFTFFNVTKTKYLQLLTTVMRWLAFIIMVTLACVRLSKGNIFHPAVSQFSGVPNLFGVCVYSFMCHHSLPSLGKFFQTFLKQNLLQLLFSSDSNQQKKAYQHVGGLRLFHHSLFLFSVGLHGDFCISRNQRSLHFELPAQSGRSLVPEDSPLLFEPFSGLYLVHQFSNHRYHFEKQPQVTFFNRWQNVFMVHSTSRFPTVGLDSTHCCGLCHQQS